jgi:hypothetical protein
MSHIPHNRVKPNQHVDLWDMGPTRPEPPKPPAEPDKAKLKGADLAAAEVEYEDAMDRYKDALRGWTAAKKSHRDWHDEMGGPRKVEHWAADARHALTAEPDRWKLDLPKGMKPGQAQIEAEEREAAERDAMEREVELDPQFGSKGA